VMKILVIGLDCAAGEILFSDERLVNFRRLMEHGCYGRLESVVPPITVPAWMCMSTGQDPGSLGVYGFRNRRDHSYDEMRVVNSGDIRQLAIWDQVAREGKRAHVIGVPPNYPPCKTSGLSVGCFLTPDTQHRSYTHPAEIGSRIAELVGPYPVDVRGFRTENKDWLKEEIFGMTRKHFAVVRHFLQRGDWDYFQFVEIGLDRVQHGFWKYHDPAHRRHVPGNPYQHVIRDYYRLLDEEVGRLLESLDAETAVLVVSDHGAKRLDGGFCVNEWLIREGLLAVHEYPRQVTPLRQLDIDWDRTQVWGEGGYYARVFLNVKGREPRGTIEPGDYEKFRDEVKARFEATVDEQGNRLGTRAFKPEQIYRRQHNHPPDLIVHLGDLYWRSVGGVGYPGIHVEENDTGPDDCNHAQHGAFILAVPGLAARGELSDLHLLDVAPTLLELGGYDALPEMQGKSFLSTEDAAPPVVAAITAADEETIRQRLSGLGYI